MSIFMAGSLTPNSRQLQAMAESNSRSGIHFVIEKNEIEKVEIEANKGSSLRQDSFAVLSAKVYPEIASQTVLKTTFKITSGEEFAEIVGNKLLPKPNSIGSTVEVVAIVDGVESENRLFFEIVQNPVEKIELADIEELSQGETFALKPQILPQTATDKSLTYAVVSGEEYLKVSKNGTLIVSGNLPEDNLSAKICVRSVSNPEIYVEKTFALHKPSVDVVSAGSNLTEVEQQGEYSFAASISSDGEESGEKPTYAVDVSADVATIDENGILKVSKTAPIGSKITVSISSNLGAVHTQTVTVASVYAKSLVVSNFTDPNKDGKYLTGSVIEFEVDFPSPYNVSEENKNYEISVNDSSLATVVGKTVAINENISQNSPKVVVTISSNQNGEILTSEVELEIYVPAKSIDLTQNIETVTEGQTYDLDALMTANVLPSNSTNKNVIYTLENENFASISGNKLVLKNNLPVGSLQIKVTAKIDAVVSNALVFEIYKPTKSLKLSASSQSPISSEAVGETVSLSSEVSETASLKNPVITIVKGAENLDGTYQNGDVIGTNIKIKNNLAALKNLNKQIVLKASQDGVEDTLSLEVYIPNENVKISADKLSRGMANPFTISNTNFADNISLEVVEKDAQIEKFDLKEKLIYVKENTPSGTVLSVTLRSLDRVGKTFTQNFVVAGLGTFDTEYTSEDLTMNDQKFNVVFGKDSDGVKINHASPQLLVGKSTVVEFKLKGFDLSYFGMYIDNVTVLSSSATVDFNKNSGKIKIELPSFASGKEVIAISVQIKDGDYPYTIPLKISAFKYLSGDLSTANGTITQNGEKIVLSAGANFDTKATTDFGAFDLTPIKTSGATFEGQKINVISVVADEVQTFKASVKQTYNFITKEYARNVSVKIRVIKIDLGGGSGFDHIAAVSNAPKLGSLGDNKLTKAGYAYAGLYYGNTVFYDANGNLKVDFGAYPNVTSLTTSWAANKYYVDFYKDAGGESALGSVEYTYGSEAYYSAPGVGDYNFSYWSVEGNDNSGEGNLKIWNFTTTPNGRVKAVCHYTKVEKKCVATGTLITLADGSKVPVENLNGDEMLLVWNFMTGTFDAAPILFIDTHGEREYLVTTLTFSDGTEVKVIGDHGFFDITLGKYVYISDKNFDEFVGHSFSKEETDANGNLVTTIVQLEKGENRTEQTNSWSPVTYSFLCYYVDGMLSMPSESDPLTNYFVIDTKNMKYDEKLMLEDIEKYGTFDYEADFAGIIPQVMFDAFNGTYLKVAMGKGILTEEALANLIQKYTVFFEEGEQSV